jgi:inorganic pyrophosphatase
MIEIPTGSTVKYEWDEKLERIRCDRILPGIFPYPANYGYIPNTLAQDGDPLDVFVLTSEPLLEGSVVSVTVIGAVMMEDEKGIDEKIIAVPSAGIDRKYSQIADIDEVATHIDEIRHFLTHYKDLDSKKWSKIGDTFNRQQAIDLVNRYRKVFDQKLASA